MKKLDGLAAVAGILVFAAACSSSGAGGRKVEITLADDGCKPATISVTAGEKLNLTLMNKSSSDAYEMEGIDGAKLEEVVVHEGKTLSVGYTVPAGSDVQKLKCYIPAGVSTIIELIPGNAGTAASGATPERSSRASTTTASGNSETTVAATLVEFSITADKSTVKAGKIQFIATNVSKDQVHELAVLKRNADGTFENMGEIEDIEAQKGGAVTLDLATGAYELACLIAPGEAGSTVDHYQQGMHTAFTVE